MNTTFINVSKSQIRLRYRHLAIDLVYRRNEALPLLKIKRNALRSRLKFISIFVVNIGSEVGHNCVIEWSNSYSLLIRQQKVNTVLHSY